MKRTLLIGLLIITIILVSGCIQEEKQYKMTERAFSFLEQHSDSVEALKIAIESREAKSFILAYPDYYIDFGFLILLYLKRPIITDIFRS